MSKSLREFFAVTRTATVYQALLSGAPTLVTMNQKGVEIARRRTNRDGMLGIAKYLIFFDHKDGGHSVVDRDVALISDRSRGFETCDVAALFLTLDEALRCSNAAGRLDSCDERWHDETVAVLQAIGDTHPSCSISVAKPNLWLMPPQAWQV